MTHVHVGCNRLERQAGKAIERHTGRRAAAILALQRLDPEAAMWVAHAAAYIGADALLALLIEAQPANTAAIRGAVKLAALQVEGASGDR